LPVHAVTQAHQYIAEGYSWCVDLDLEKLFDRVNHDKLMGQIAKRIKDKRLLKTHSSVLERRSDGECERGRNPTRRSAFATAQQFRA
jgi:retron-type reverse transcriptase